MKKKLSKKIVYSAAATAVFAGSAVSGMNAIANADNELKEFDKDSIVSGEYVADEQAYPYSSSENYDYSYMTPTSGTPTPTTTPEEPPRGSIKGSGAVNCESGEACIDPETGIAHVEYKVQLLGPISKSNPSLGNTSFIAIPKVIDPNSVKVKIDSVYYDKSDPFEKEDYSLTKINENLPIVYTPNSTLKDVDKRSEKTEYEAIWKKYQEDTIEYIDIYNDKYRKENPPPQREDFHSDYNYSIENFKYHNERRKILNNMIKEYEARNRPVILRSFEDSLKRTPNTMLQNGISDDFRDLDMTYLGEDGKPVMNEDSWTPATYSTKNAELYNYLEINNNYGISNYTISGDVKIDSDIDEIYLPIKAELKQMACPVKYDEILFNGKSISEECRSLKKFDWAKTGDLPKYDINDASVNKNLAKHYSPDGLGGNPFCAVTRNVGREDKIGEDVNPRNMNISEKDGPEIYSIGDMYANKFNIPESNSDYIIGGYGVNEDGCDQAAVKVVRCDEKETETETPSPRESTSSDPTPSEETSSSSEVTSSEPPTHETSETPKTNIPEPSETPRKGTSTPPVILTHEPKGTESIPTTTEKTTEPEARTIEKTTEPGARIIENKTEPKHVPPVVKHTFPEKQPVPNNPSRVNNPPIAPAQPAAIPGPVSQHGPVVNTGGEVQESFWTKISNIFR